MVQLIVKHQEHREQSGNNNNTIDMGTSIYTLDFRGIQMELQHLLKMATKLKNERKYEHLTVKL